MPIRGLLILKPREKNNKCQQKYQYSSIALWYPYACMSPNQREITLETELMVHVYLTIRRDRVV